MRPPKAPSDRVRRLNDRPVEPTRRYVLYWMIAARRTRSSFALDRAIAWARALNRPLVVLEALRVGYPWASDRLHRFVLDGMADNAARFHDAGILHYPYVEPEADAGHGLLAALSADACVVVTDEFPAFFLPKMVAAAAARVTTAFEQVDGNGLVPLRGPDRSFVTARAFRRWLHEGAGEYLAQAPKADPLRGLDLPPPPRITPSIERRWRRADPRLLSGEASLDTLPIDHDVAPTTSRGGSRAAHTALRAFVAHKLDRYADERRHPDADAESGLSPYLHFGHISSHEIARAVARHAGSNPRRIVGLGTNEDAFLDQLVTWRELGFNTCLHRRDYATYESLPSWARRTLDAHAKDPRPELYDLATLEAARTHDPLWNASQRQLLRDGRLHNYLRMLWGKRIVAWSPSPKVALARMIHLNDKYALDGRDPNSYSGMLWVLGRYDRPWGPERPIFGLVRFMTSESAARKLRLRAYLARYGDTRDEDARAADDL